ncbi:hypothetical protein EXIGLDRAFT_769509 [Exidia glandulosa HHB12029]|uniref:Uncharacterized protein n=1 Tax=Exidia glandulosa HHB12029 TaxID=1314781 RepID=A0A165HG87_EXIGL|nr:hypothetical protein EXIGLDRAFT_769509 [Exidia glandulosa HHB12029]
MFFRAALLSFALAGLGLAQDSPAAPMPEGSYKYNASTPTALDPSAEELEWLKSINWSGMIWPLESFAAVYVDDPNTTVPVLASDADATLVKRTTYRGIYICTDVNWGGQCGYAQQPTNECISLQAPWWSAISSWGPDPGQKCYGYNSNLCKYWAPDGCDVPSECIRYGGNPSIGPVRAPGLSTVPQWQDGDFNWNDHMNSWICYVE